MERSTYTGLLDAAQNLIQRDGFNAFSYRHLSEAVGIRTASIHYHFPTKEDLGEALVRRYREHFAGVLAEIKRESLDARSSLERYAERFLETLKDDGKICLCGMLASDYPTLPRDVQNEVKAFFVENHAWIAHVLQEGLEDGTFKFRGTSEDVAMTFFSTLTGSMFDARMFDDSERLVRSIRSWLDLISHKE